MTMEKININLKNKLNESEVNPVTDIIDYLVRSANISFKNSHANEQPVRTCEKLQMALEIYKRSPVEFLMQFGKYLAPNHIKYFENISSSKDQTFRNYVHYLSDYHSETSRRKRIRNRRYKALQKMKIKTDYFSEKQMMYRNPLLYEQLVGQYLTDEEIKERDRITENVSFLNLILETVDHNHMREVKNVQMLEEGIHETPEASEFSLNDSTNENINFQHKRKWGEFTTPDTKPDYIPENRKQRVISAPEKKLLYDEFLQEMYSSFIDGNDIDIDYKTIDNDEQYDDLEQESQDAEDKYFDSETNDVENLEEHMHLVEEYGQSKINNLEKYDPLDVFMEHISKKFQLN